jgi:hypothetical protein
LNDATGRAGTWFARRGRALPWPALPDVSVPSAEGSIGPPPNGRFLHSSPAIEQAARLRHCFVDTIRQESTHRMANILFSAGLALSVLAVTIGFGAAVCRRTRDSGLLLLLLGLILQLVGALAGRLAYSVPPTAAPALQQAAYYAPWLAGFVVLAGWIVLFFRKPGR